MAGSLSGTDVPLMPSTRGMGFDEQQLAGSSAHTPPDTPGTQVHAPLRRMWGGFHGAGPRQDRGVRVMDGHRLVLFTGMQGC